MREKLYRGKRIDNGEWEEGFYFETGASKYGFITVPDSEDHLELIGNPIEDLTYVVAVDPETVGQFTGKTLLKGNKVFEGTIAFYEEESEEGDIRTYLVCVWIEEWSMFAWLTTGEYIKFQDMGAESLDEESFWTYTLERSNEYHHAGNIHDNPELLNK